MSDEKKCCNFCYPHENGKLPLNVCEKVLKRWREEAQKWAAETKKKVSNGDLPPGFDPDDEDTYPFRPPHQSVTAGPTEPKKSQKK